MLVGVDIVAVGKYNKSRFGNTSTFGNGCLSWEFLAKQIQHKGTAMRILPWGGNMATCKLAYMLRSMGAPRNELIWLIDKDSENEFCRFNTRLVEQFPSRKPIEGDSIEAFLYKQDKYLYTSLCLRYQTIFARINQLCEESRIYPIFADPTNVEQCLATREDVLDKMSESQANAFFGVESFAQYQPPLYINPKAYPAVLEPAENGGYNVTVPDIFGGVTCGDDYDSALAMAKDMIAQMLAYAPAQCFPPRTLEKTQQNFPDKIVVMIPVEKRND